MPKQYQTEYDSFIATYKKGLTDPEDTGQLISRLAQYFAQTNSDLGEKWKKMVTVAAEINSQTDENTGKAIAANKAEVKVNATPEAAALNDAKIDRENIEAMINALKSLQKGQLNEFSHMNV
jgi:ABC-type transporter Mla subunit MlaD